MTIDDFAKVELIFCVHPRMNTTYGNSPLTISWVDKDMVLAR